jgi:HK97 gp10 family phage protein
MPITVSGLNELSTLLTEETARTAKRYLLKVAQPAADVVIEEMKTTAPDMTHRLEEGIGSQSRFTNGEQTTLLVTIGPAWETFWGAFQEFGSSTYPALHWMERAWEGCKDRCMDVFLTEATGMLLDLENKK